MRDAVPYVSKHIYTHLSSADAGAFKPEAVSTLYDWLAPLWELQLHSCNSSDLTPNIV